MMLWYSRLITRDKVARLRVPAKLSPKDVKCGVRVGADQSVQCCNTPRWMNNDMEEHITMKFTVAAWIMIWLSESLIELFTMLIVSYNYRFNFCGSCLRSWLDHQDYITQLVLNHSTAGDEGNSFFVPRDN